MAKTNIFKRIKLGIDAYSKEREKQEKEELALLKKKAQLAKEKARKGMAHT